jgi:hypothetical protein
MAVHLGNARNPITTGFVAGEKTHVQAARPKSDDLPYRGPVVEVPELPADQLDEHGTPRTAPQPTNGGIEPGLSLRTIRDLADAYQERTYAQYQESGSTDVDHRLLDAWLRRQLAELGVFSEFIDTEFKRVMQAVFAV